MFYQLAMLRVWSYLLLSQVQTCWRQEINGQDSLLLLGINFFLWPRHETLDTRRLTQSSGKTQSNQKYPEKSQYVIQLDLDVQELISNQISCF